MATSTPPAAAHQPARRPRAMLRPVHPSTVIAVTIALVLGGTTLASAANGGNFLLGEANKETATASLSNTKGTPLSLSAPAGKAPLAVNQKTLVQNFNAQYTGGLTAGQLQVTGGDGFTLPSTSTPIDQNFEVVASTGHLPAGTYYVTATALLSVAAGDIDGFCAIIRGSAPTSFLADGGEDGQGFLQAAETTAVAITAGDTLQEECNTGGFNGSSAYNAGITAIRILSSHGTSPAHTGTPATPPGPASPSQPRPHTNQPTDPGTSSTHL